MGAWGLREPGEVVDILPFPAKPPEQSRNTQEHQFLLLIQEKATKKKKTPNHPNFLFSHEIPQFVNVGNF